MDGEPGPGYRHQTPQVAQDVESLPLQVHGEIRVGSEQPHGTYIKTTLFRDHYLLSLDDETYNAQDWRVLAAVAVALDALQSR